MKEKKIFIIAGEPSGDNLGARFMDSLLNNNKKISIKFSGIGGGKMEKEGLKSLFPIKELSVMGLIEVFSNIFQLNRRLEQTTNEIIEQKPDVVFTIDSPSFCFRVMKKLKSKDKELFKKIKKIHLIAPSVWAYKKKRAEKISKLYDLLLCILPFEPLYFEKYGLKTEFIQHPIFDDVEDFENISIKKYDEVGIILTPGSRVSEVKRLYPIMIKTIKLLKIKTKRDYRIFTYVNSNTQKIVDFVRKKYIFDTKIIIDENEKKQIGLSCDVVLAKSGTNTFEFNILGLPLIIIYTFNYLTNKIGKILIKIKFANLVNILANREIIPEFIAERAKPDLIVNKLEELINDKELANKQVKETQEIIKQLGYRTGIKASQLGAEKILDLIK